MRSSLTPWSHIPLRVAVGAFFINSGLSKRKVRGEAAEHMQAFAAAGVPAVRKLPPDRFITALSYGEVALGTALLLPVVPSAVAGAGLLAFSTGLISMYLKTPGMREEGGLRPTQEGIGLAKDTWLVGAGITLVLDPRSWPGGRILSAASSTVASHGD